MAASPMEYFTRYCFWLFLLIVITLGIALTIKNSKAESREEFELFQNSTTNRYPVYYHYNYMEDDQAGKDIHIFNQKKLNIFKF